MQTIRARGREFDRALNQMSLTFNVMVFRAALLADINQWNVMLSRRRPGILLSSWMWHRVAW